MPQPDESPDEAFSRLGKRLDALEAGRAPKPSPTAPGAMGEGYRFLTEVVGGVLGGTGLGWLIDHFAGTKPFGLVGGLLIGTGVSIFAAMIGAAKMAKAQSEAYGPAPSVPDDDDND